VRADAEGGSADLESRLVALLERRAAGLDDIDVGSVDRLVARARSRRWRKTVIAASIAGVLAAGVIWVVPNRDGDVDPAGGQVTSGRVDGMPERIGRRWASVPLRLGLTGTPGAEVISVTDADWAVGTRPLGPHGVSHQRLRPAYDRFEGPTIDVTSSPGRALPPDADQSAPTEPLAGHLGRLWVGGDGRVRAVWEAAGRTVIATALGLAPDVVRTTLRGWASLDDGRIDSPSADGLSLVLDLSEPPQAGATSEVRYRLTGGTEAAIAVTLGDRDTFEASLGGDGGWGTLSVRGMPAAVRGAEARWYEPANDAVVHVTAASSPALMSVLSGLRELTEQEFERLRGG
jgi:hypothetical protein